MPLPHTTLPGFASLFVHKFGLSVTGIGLRWGRASWCALDAENVLDSPPILWRDTKHGTASDCVTILLDHNVFAGAPNLSDHCRSDRSGCKLVLLCALLAIANFAQGQLCQNALAHLDHGLVPFPAGQPFVRRHAIMAHGKPCDNERCVLDDPVHDRVVLLDLYLQSGF